MSSTATSTPLSVLLLGATGYVGGATLHRLLRSPLTAQWQITLVTRGAGNVEKLHQFAAAAQRQVTIVVASHSEVDRLQQLAAASDIVINVADSDDLPLVRALGAGLKQRGESGATPLRRPFLVHTSGTSVFSDPAEEDGNTPPTHTFSDVEPEDFWSLPVSAPHHEVDLAVLAANDGGVDTVIVIPPTIYGTGSGLRQHSIQVPQLIKAALLRTVPQAGTLGQGVNRWNSIHIEDLTAAYELILKNVVAGTAPTGREGVFYPTAEGGEYAHFELAALIGRTLHRLAPEVVRTDEVRQFTQAEIDATLFGKFAGMVFGGNAVVKCERLGRLGWKSTNITLEQSLEEESKRFLKLKEEGKLDDGYMPSMDK